MRNKKNNTPIVVSSHDVYLDSDYVQWIHDIKSSWDGILFCENQRKNGGRVLLSS